MSQQKWISITRAFRRLHVSKDTMLKIADREKLVRRQLPGVNRVEFLLEDIERIERDSVIVAEARPAPSQAIAS